MEISELSDFYLVGGTGLSLLYWHRISKDLDLFSNQPFENDEIINGLKVKYKEKFEYRSTNLNFGIFEFVEGVKVDLVFFTHPLIKPTIEIHGIRVFSIEDIIAMNVQAVLGRAKKKDFWDIAEQLQHFSLADFIQFHKQKYATQNLIITVPQAITYFADAEETPDPISLKGQTWETIKQIIGKKVSEYLL
ncbi:MAG: nucleotidyl transferase AbiEii/AbiGii toxin family protein [Bacteroidota bacterium]|nr:nucleotidyl transferase AbiEii/AbiGii toxin family protein [Bacteroidota bacterium]